MATARYWRSDIVSSFLDYLEDLKRLEGSGVCGSGDMLIVALTNRAERRWQEAMSMLLVSEERTIVA